MRNMGRAWAQDFLHSGVMKLGYEMKLLSPRFEFFFPFDGFVLVFHLICESTRFCLDKSLKMLYRKSKNF